ncbi:DUF3311 domain-containing protein [Actinophytocola gossypii]|uniref:DUF3311 domain-containing protein n=1 Tax=Actinophytocola gossypii TaxID=2812003 RepID=A0ABT2JCA2_9PSEU|nr:DUF3311 domain-containing protein [Actinophytocola gossypii]MCT2585477.1 DUF3311 domain-containing protein [Actinophytocola gossypii]
MTSDKSGSRVTGLVFNPWNLLLLLPFIALFTPLYNQTEPELIGLPFFYWFQFVIILLGVLSTLLVYRMTRSARTVPPPDDGPDVDELDEGSVR